MFTLSIAQRDGKPRSLSFESKQVSIGRIQSNDIVLQTNNISKNHAKLLRDNENIVVVDTNSTNGTFVNGQRIYEPRQLDPGDKIFIGDFVIEIDNHGSLEQTGPLIPSSLRKNSLEAPLSDDDWGNRSESSAQELGNNWNNAIEMNLQNSVAAPAPMANATSNLLEAVVSELPQGPIAPKQFDNPSTHGSHSVVHNPVAPFTPEKPCPQSAPLDQVFDTIHERLVRSMELRGATTKHVREDELRSRTEQNVRDIIEAMISSDELSTDVDKNALIQQVLDETLRLGALEPLLNDDSVTRIFVNHAKQIYIERNSKLELSDLTFSGDQALLGIIERLIAPTGKRINESSPLINVKLRNRSRINAVLPPLAFNGPTLTIEKPPKELLNLSHVINSGTFSPKLVEFLQLAVEAKRTILVSGPSGSGKTTTLKVLSTFIPDSERIITIEDVTELSLSQEHVVALESRPPDTDGVYEIGTKDLLVHALSMRPDRLVVGECCGDEAFNLLEAINSGHQGSLTTVRANSPTDALSKLESMVLASGVELPLGTIRHQISHAIDLIVQLKQFPDSSIRITHITEIAGIERDSISMQGIFVYPQLGTSNDQESGGLQPTGLVPQFYKNLPPSDIVPDLTIFEPS